jgi:hypothetical protein
VELFQGGPRDPAIPKADGPLIGKFRQRGHSGAGDRLEGQSCVGCQSTGSTADERWRLVARWAAGEAVRKAALGDVSKACTAVYYCPYEMKGVEFNDWLLLLFNGRCAEAWLLTIVRSARSFGKQKYGDMPPTRHSRSPSG